MGNTTPIERVVYVMGKGCVEDFFEIILLASNGYGIGATKLLRSLYESAVTMTYLSQHPEEVDLFLNYHAVTHQKFLNAMKRTYGKSLLPEEQEKEAQQQYEKVKKDYEVTDCKTCGTKRMNYTWSKLNMVDMAHKTGMLAELIVEGYLEPLKYAHSTVQRLLAQVERAPAAGGLLVKAGPYPKEADWTLHIAHLVILSILKTQNEFFTIHGFGRLLQTCFQDFEAIWTKDKLRDLSTLETDGTIPM